MNHPVFGGLKKSRQAAKSEFTDIKSPYFYRDSFIGERVGQSPRNLPTADFSRKRNKSVLNEPAGARPDIK